MPSSSLNDCDASYDAWDRAMKSFALSVSSERVAGRYSTTVVVKKYTYADVDYSGVTYNTKDTVVNFVRYTPTDGNMPPLSSYSRTATRITTRTETETYVFEPTYTGKGPECDPICADSPNSCTISAGQVQLIY